ncbi:hypothetical protein JHS3_16580 [Jeongeupia sp. HS-3]|uniref:hypothetical protein n=1 Tax=Jeongeupia sp. HS-3 TaxID=1009682 RepID=UPI0018A366DD|nr:hypothetical protein [Jeongeupia sp. HS-3]BCL75922.1 hypothetical protein JHS3_16580 [Jeongeupia sp. HS-3]
MLMLQTVYAKTTQGQAEIDTRRLGLSARARRLLILIDGQRTLADIATVLGHADLAPLLAELKTHRCIDAPDRPAVVTDPIAIAPPAPAETRQPRPLDAVDPIRIIKAKELMTESTHEFLGLMGRGLISEIEAVADAPALKNAIARWNMALRESRKAGPYADQFVEAVKVLTGL